MVLVDYRDRGDDGNDSSGYSYNDVGCICIMSDSSTKQISIKVVGYGG